MPGSPGVVPIHVRILGPVEALTDDGGPVPLGPPKQRALFVLLLLQAGRGSPVADLVDALWPTDPPRSAVKNLQLYVHRLRKLLGGGLTFRDGVYRIEPGAHRLDVVEFEALVARARRAAAVDDPDAAAAAYRAALGRWRGRALADLVDRGLLVGRATALDRARLTVLDESVELAVRRRGPAALLPELSRLIAEFPAHERFREHQIRGLLATGRHAEAAAAYREAARVLATELGVAPGPGLRGLAAAFGREQPAVWVAQRQPVPAQLPADIADFTGRQAAVADALGYLGGDGSAMRIWTISGTAGVGKTSLAVHVAHLLRARYPDGQLYAGLHGQSPHPADPADVSAQFLRALGVPAAGLPVDPEERVRLFRSRLADRRVLVLLDDAATESQVRPLLPGGARCAAIVTSRSPLTGLVGARNLALDVLDGEQAVELLAVSVGRDRVRAQEEAASTIVALCGRLPLAVRIAAARLASRPHWSLTRFAAMLADNRRRLDELRAGDLDVRASFQLSYDGLEPEARRAFHLLALLDTPTVTVWLAAAMLRVERATAERLLERLVDAQLLQALPDDRYRSHDLLRVYAAEQAVAAEPAAEREAALDAAFAAWASAAEQAAAALTGGADLADGGAAPAGAAQPTGPGAEIGDPRGWFSREQADLVAAVDQAHRTGRWEATWRLAQALTSFLEERSQWSAWRRTHESALDAARAAGNAGVEAVLAQRLGDLYRDRGRFQQAGVYFRRSLELAEAVGSELRRGYALRGLGDVAWGRGDAREAVEHYRRALALFDAVGERRGTAYALRGLSVAYRGLGQLDAALEMAGRCVAVFRSLGDVGGEAYARRTLGSIRLDLGDHDEAVECFDRARAEFERLGDRLGVAAALLGIGMTRVEQERYAEAAQTYRHCRAAFAEVADPLGEAYAGRGLGDALTGLGRYAEAEAELRAALAVFVAQDDLRWQAYALFSLGRLHAACGEPDAAREKLHRCLSIFERMAARYWTDRTRRALAELGADASPVG